MALFLATRQKSRRKMIWTFLTAMHVHFSCSRYHSLSTVLFFLFSNFNISSGCTYVFVHILVPFGCHFLIRVLSAAVLSFGFRLLLCSKLNWKHQIHNFALVPLFILGYVVPLSISWYVCKSCKCSLRHSLLAK